MKFVTEAQLRAELSRVWDMHDAMKAEITELRAFKAACEGQEPVAMVDDDGIINVTRYTYKPGNMFYLHPDPEAAQLRILVKELESEVELQHRKDELLYHGVTHASALVRIAELESENEILKGEVEYWKSRFEMTL